MPRPRAVIAAKQAEQLAKAQASAGVVRHVKQKPAAALTQTPLIASTAQV